MRKERSAVLRGGGASCCTLVPRYPYKTTVAAGPGRGRTFDAPRLVVWGPFIAVVEREKLVCASAARFGPPVAGALPCNRL